MQIRTLAPAVMLLALGCSKKEPEPTAKAERKVAPAATPTASALGTAKVQTQDPARLRALLSKMNQQAGGGSAPKVAAKPVASVTPSPDDPLKGQFDIEQAGKGLKGEGYFVATMETTAGTLECELWHDKAPITVANFVGLARGLRPFKDPSGKWVKKPLYDGTPFHRVVKGFMIQGGDPAGNGSGGPGYVIPDEVWEDAHHDERGQLCMANRGPNTNGSQFFIMDGKASHLDGGYTIFGKCGPESVIEKIADSPVRGDRATEPVKIQSVKVRREAKLPATATTAATAATPAADAGVSPQAAPSAAP